MSFERQTTSHAFRFARNSDANEGYLRSSPMWLDAGEASPASRASAVVTDTPCRFDIYREDQVRLTATRLSGGDWHWRLSDAAGTPLVEAGGYRSEKECRDAVSILRSEAAFATMPHSA